MKIGFWNIAKNNDPTSVKDLIESEHLDFLGLAESDRLEKDDFYSYLKHSRYHYLIPNKSKIRVLTKISPSSIFNIVDENRLYAFQTLLEGLKVNIIYLHLPSKNYNSNDDQLSHAFSHSSSVKGYEKQFGSEYTILIGDFNMNPFEPGMVQTTGFHSVSDISVAKKIKRVVDGNEYHYFYNPMWSYFGDKSLGKVSGSYFYHQSTPTCYFWNLFDQVLIRPKLLEILKDYDLDIITELGISGKSLITDSGTIDKNISDHLPIILKLKIHE